MKTLLSITVALGLLAAASAMVPRPPQSSPAGAQSQPAVLDFSSREYLYQVVRHLYRWYLDERDLDALAGARELEFQVRPLRPKLDANDRSQFGEITLPQLGVRVKVKRPDYTIAELDTVVKSDTFRIVSVSKETAGGEPPPDGRSIRLDFAALREELYRTRRDAKFPEGELLERLRQATRRELLKDVARENMPPPAGPQVIHMAPLSPIANETWVFWESGRMLLHFASDIDLANPAVWEHEQLVVRAYDIDRQVVVSLDEVPGSNAFLTRDQVGRALFNCVILGRRIELQPLTDKAAGPPTTQDVKAGGR